MAHNLSEQQISDLLQLKEKLDSGCVIVDAKQLDQLTTERSNLLSAIYSLQPILNLVKPKPGEQLNIMAVIGEVMPKLPTLMPNIQASFGPIEHLLTGFATEENKG